MDSDIVIIRDGETYRLLYGHLRLATVLSSSNEVFVDIKGEGKVQVVKTRHGLHIHKDATHHPLLHN